eukprot:CAMPEP_0168623742 /NCGR_PEP_ID=MMETSP0449_2-20121227/8994_1 /TAXON_ID=1082188 /ORGANISM="Strombidium rassoulzadegani, Strain ras09" /LENGTH=178 /DNA_ID=CAMNT_0008665157 /DNA_START=60 /DNA_END=596 /DNA_ORIENTATION=-
MASITNMTSARVAASAAPRRASKQCSFATGSTRFSNRLSAARVPRQSRAMAAPPRAETLWSLKVDADKTIPSIMQMELTKLMDCKREGPNKTCKLVVGASEDGTADVIVPVETVSGRHAELEEDGDTGRLYVTDLGSTNGTWLNGKVIKGRTEINPGDELSFGGEPLFVCYRDAHAHA